MNIIMVLFLLDVVNTERIAQLDGSVLLYSCIVLLKIIIIIIIHLICNALFIQKNLKMP